jgi:hypothetical protein
MILVCDTSYYDQPNGSIMLEKSWCGTTVNEERGWKDEMSPRGGWIGVLKPITELAWRNAELNKHLFSSSTKPKYARLN